MNRKTGLVSGVSAALIALPLAVGAADFSGYSTEDLAGMRGTMRNATAEEREAFRNEWQKRTQSMTQEERQQYGNVKGQGAGGGKGNMHRKGGGGKR